MEQLQQRCSYCANLSIESLVSLAVEEFDGHQFPRQAFFEHHRSFGELEESAETGCGFCQVILESFKTATRVPAYDRLLDATRRNKSESLYAAARLVEPSYVKISINSDHVYSLATLDQVQVFDTILIQVGRTSPRAGEGGTKNDRGEPFLEPVKLRIKTARDSVIHMHGRRIGRLETDSNLGSNGNFDIARSWLKTCQNEHPRCCLELNPKLPTRVIDIGDTAGSTQPRIIHSHGAKASYVALSHRWGGEISPVLSTETLQTFQESIPIDALPQNFQDAMSITRQLDIRHVWIDCLCVLQDCPEDWAHESKNMGRVYRDSTLTLYASASTGSTDGILQEHSESGLQSKRAVLKVFSDQATDEEVTVERCHQTQESMRDLESSGPLSRRGWTLQEWALAPRQLHYGAKLIYWRCREGYKSSDDLPMGNLFPDHMYDDITSVFFSNNKRDGTPTTEETAGVLRDYYKLVSEYSGRHLTYDCDKLPAFSGLCERLHHALDGEFLAGLWTCDVVHGLLWYKDWRPCKHVQPYRAPSWSWAVVNDPVIYDDEPMTPGNLNLQLMGYDIKLRDQSNPYGEVVSGEIVVEGLNISLTRSRQVIDVADWHGRIGDVFFDEPTCYESFPSVQLYIVCEEEYGYRLMTVGIDIGVGCQPDWEIDTTLWSSQEYCALLVHGNVEDELAKAPAYGLVLQRVSSGSEKVYQRVGFFRIQIHEPASFYLKWKKETITLV